MRYEVICDVSGGPLLLELTLPPGATLSDALLSLRPRLGVEFDPTVAIAGVWGERRPGNYELQPGDRVEVYRPLARDPRQARRERVGGKKPRRKR